MDVWRISLDGDKETLELLRESEQITNAKVVVEDVLHYLEVEDSDPNESEEAFRERATVMLEQALGTLGLHTAFGVGHVEIGSITKRYTSDGRSGVWARVPTGKVVMTAFPPTILIDGKVVSAPDPTIDELFKHYRDDEYVRRVVRHLTTKKNRPVNLWKAYELVREKVPTQDWISKGWTSESEWKRFKESVQVEEAVGEDARHATKPYRLSDPPMDEDACFFFMTIIVHKWLAERYKQENPPQP